MLEPTASSEYVQMLTRGKEIEESSCRQEDGNCDSISSSWQVGHFTTNSLNFL